MYVKAMMCGLTSLITSLNGSDVHRFLALHHLLCNLHHLSQLLPKVTS